MNNFLLTLSIIAQLTGLTLPKVLDEQLYILPTYSADNELHLDVQPLLNDLPTIKKKQVPQSQNLDWGPGDLQATAAIVADVDTGQILWQKNQNQQLPIASITKLMTVLVFMDHNPGWDYKYKMRPDENNLIGAKLKIDNGQELTTHDLLRTTLVGSANNTAKALARSTGLSDEAFVQAMNDKAELLGLNNSVFVEPTGLEQGNKSTVSDLVVIFREVLNHKALRDAMILEKHALEIPPDNHVHEVKSTNKLLQDDEVNVIAGKTGFTYEAGYCLITAAVDDQGHEIIVAVLGLDSESKRDAENKKLIKWTFANYIWK